MHNRGLHLKKLKCCNDEEQGRRNVSGAGRAETKLRAIQT